MDCRYLLHLLCLEIFLVNIENGRYEGGYRKKWKNIYILWGVRFLCDFYYQWNKVNLQTNTKLSQKYFLI